MIDWHFWKAPRKIPCWTEYQRSCLWPTFEQFESFLCWLFFCSFWSFRLFDLSSPLSKYRYSKVPLTWISPQYSMLCVVVVLCNTTAAMSNRSCKSKKFNETWAAELLRVLFLSSASFHISFNNILTACLIIISCLCNFLLLHFSFAMSIWHFLMLFQWIIEQKIEICCRKFLNLFLVFFVYFVSSYFSALLCVSSCQNENWMCWFWSEQRYFHFSSLQCFTYKDASIIIIKLRLVSVNCICSSDQECDNPR